MTVARQALESPGSPRLVAEVASASAHDGPEVAPLWVRQAARLAVRCSRPRRREDDGAFLRPAPARGRAVERQPAVLALVVREAPECAGLNRAGAAATGDCGAVARAEGSPAVAGVAARLLHQSLSPPTAECRSRRARPRMRRRGRLVAASHGGRAAPTSPRMRLRSPRVGVGPSIHAGVNAAVLRCQSARRAARTARRLQAATGPKLRAA